MRRLACLCVLAWGLIARAEEPFSVWPVVEQTNGTARLRVAFGVPSRHFLYADKLSFALDGATATGAFKLPHPALMEDRFSGKQKKVFAEPFEATTPLPAIRTKALSLSVHFQGCDDANCFFPEDKAFVISPDGSLTAVDAMDMEVAGASAPTPEDWRILADGFAVVAQASGYLKEREFLTFLDQTRSASSTMPELPGQSGSGGVFWMICLIVLGGVALNLTPCILPMIPINIAIIGAGAQAGSKKRGFALGATYAAGMAIAYGVLGVIVVLTGSKFGTLNSSPWFNLGIALVFGLLALGMFDLLTIDLSRFQAATGGATAGARGKFAVAYTMGTVAALLAGACVAPVVISVLLQATTLYTHGNTAGVFLPFLLGLGMGLPWPFAGAGLSFLPKPGRWMTRVKYAFGVFIIFFAASHAHLSFKQFLSGEPLTASVAAVSSGADSGELCRNQLARALRQAQADGQPIFIDFWASWCKNCSAMEHTTFESAAVKTRLAGFRQVRLQTEHPNRSPAKEVLDHFKVMGLPSYVILKPKTSPPLPAETPGDPAATSR